VLAGPNTTGSAGLTITLCTGAHVLHVLHVLQGAAGQHVLQTGAAGQHFVGHTGAHVLQTGAAGQHVVLTGLIT
jgi:hypothetical protein